VLRTRSLHPENRLVEIANHPGDRLSGGHCSKSPRPPIGPKRIVTNKNMDKAEDTLFAAPLQAHPSCVPKRFGYLLLDKYHPPKLLSRLFFLLLAIAPFDTFLKMAIAGIRPSRLNAKTFWDFC
jgi:hypothetical protein